EVAHLRTVEDAPSALVRDRRVEVAILDDDLAALERGPHLGRDVVRPVCGIQQRLGARGHVTAAVQHDLPQLDAEVCAARLARAHHRVARIRHPGGEQLRLGRLPRAVAALESDEQAGCRATHERYAAGFLGAAFFAAGFFAAVFLAADFLAATFFLGAALAFGFAGPLAR